MPSTLDDLAKVEVEYESERQTCSALKACVARCAHNCVSCCGSYHSSFDRPNYLNFDARSPARLEAENRRNDRVGRTSGEREEVRRADRAPRWGSHFVDRHGTRTRADGEEGLLIRPVCVRVAPFYSGAPLTCTRIPDI